MDFHDHHVGRELTSDRSINCFIMVVYESFFYWRFGQKILTEIKHCHRQSFETFRVSLKCVLFLHGDEEPFAMSKENLHGCNLI